MKTLKTLIAYVTTVTLVAAWAAAVVGLLLLIDLLVMPLQIGLMLLLFAVVMMTRCGWHSKAARVISRILCLLVPVAATVLFIVDAVLSAMDGVPAMTVLMYASVMAAPLLCWHLPAAAVVADKGGKLDGWILRIVSTYSFVVAVLCCFTSISGYIAWHWDVQALRVVWALLSLAACVLSWVCHWHPQDIPTAPVARRLPEEKDADNEKAAETSSAAE